MRYMFSRLFLQSSRGSDTNNSHMRWGGTCRPLASILTKRKGVLHQFLVVVDAGLELRHTVPSSLRKSTSCKWRGGELRGREKKKKVWGVAA